VAEELRRASGNATEIRVRSEPIAMLRAENDERLEKMLTDAQWRQER
jgi:hypothetical protein